MMEMDTTRLTPVQSAAKVALIFAAFSSACILISDHLLGRHVGDIAAVTRIAMLKD